MAYGYRSSSGRFNSRGGSYRSPRGRGTSYRGRGRGSDSYYNSGSRDTRDSFTDRSSFRDSSFRGSSYRGKDDHYGSRGSRNSRYSQGKYRSSRGRRDEDSSHHRRDIRESASGSYGREHVHRSNDGESDRKRMKSDFGSSFKEGYSPRRSYDELEHSSRHFNSTNRSPYRSDSSPFGEKSYKREFNDFKKPLPPARSSYSGRRPSRGIRGRGGSTRITTNRIVKTPAPSYLKRGTVGRGVSRLKTASRLQLILRKKKQIQMSIMRMRKERDERVHLSPTEKLNDIEEEDSKFSDGDDIFEENIEDDLEEMEVDAQDEPTTSSKASKEPVEKKEVKKAPVAKKQKPEAAEPSEKSSSELDSPDVKEKKFPPARTTPYVHIALKCPHCKTQCKMFKSYQHHLTTPRHKIAMEKLLYNLKQKLRRMRMEQRDQQRDIDERDDNYNRTSYCKLCKLNFKQTKQEHVTSDYHVGIAELLNSKCSICRMTFNTPIMYEHHRCTLTHIKRKAFLERKGALSRTAELDDENNEDDSFMVLDSVEADESSDEADTSTKSLDSEPPKKKRTAIEAKNKTTIIGSAYIEKVSIYYCKLCKLSLHYNPNRDAEEVLLTHCRTRFHLKRFSVEEAKKKAEVTKKRVAPPKKDAATDQDEADKIEDDASADANDKESEQVSMEDDVVAEAVVDDHKSSEDEDDSLSENRFDRFGTSDEKDSVDKVNAVVEEVDGEEKKDPSENTETEKTDE